MPPDPAARDEEKQAGRRPALLPFRRGRGTAPALGDKTPGQPPKARAGAGFDPFIFLDEKHPPGASQPYNPIEERPVKAIPVPAAAVGPEVVLVDPVNPYTDFKDLPSGVKVNPESAGLAPPLLPGAEVSPPLGSNGTPIQISNKACGQAVVQGIIVDAGGPHVSEQALAGIRTTGTEGLHVAEWLDRYGAEVTLHDNVGIGDVRKLLDNGHQVMVGVKTRSATNGHWVRIEGIKDGFVHYGDPWQGKSYRVLTADFVRIMDRRDVVAVKWPRGVVPPAPPPGTARKPKPGRSPRPPRAGISASAETALHKVGVKHRVQLVKHGTQMTAIVTGPSGELIEQIHYTPTSRSSTQKAARALIGAASDIGTVAMILETAGRLFFLLEAFHAIKDMTDPQRPLDLLEKYANVLQAAARAAQAGDWTQVSGELVAWSQEMAKLGGPFASGGGGFIMWVQDHWLATYGAEAITGMPPDYLMWLSREYREYVRKARAELARAESGVLEVPIEEHMEDEPAPATVAVARATPVPRQRHTSAEPLTGLTRSQVRERIGEQTAIVDDVQRTIRDIDNWLDELGRWEEKVTPDAERGEAWAVNTVAYIHRSRTANDELRKRKERELEAAIDQRTAYEEYPEDEIIEERGPQPTYSGLTAAEIEHAIFHESQRVAELETAILDSHDYIDYLRDWRKVELETRDSPQTIQYIDAQLQAHEILLQRRLSELEDARSRLVQEELELSERVSTVAEESSWPTEGVPTSWRIPSLEAMREMAMPAPEESSFVRLMRDFVSTHPGVVKAAALAAVVAAIAGGGSWAAIAAFDDDPATAAGAATSPQASGQNEGNGQSAGPSSNATTAETPPETAEETAGAAQEAPSPSPDVVRTTTEPATTVTETRATETTVPVTEQPGQSQPTAEPTAEETPPTEEPSPTQPPLVSGTYSGQPSEVQHPHRGYFEVSNTWNVLQTRETTTLVITLRLRGMLTDSPNMEIATNIPATGAPFTATDTFSVAGYTTTVSFSGTLTFQGLTGTLTVGGDGALPGGEASIWQISFVKTAGP